VRRALGYRFGEVPLDGLDPLGIVPS